MTKAIKNILKKDLFWSIARLFVIIGAINWGLILFRINIIATIFRFPLLISIVYAFIGMSGLWMLIKLLNN